MCIDQMFLIAAIFYTIHLIFTVEVQPFPLSLHVCQLSGCLAHTVPDGGVDATGQKVRHVAALVGQGRHVEGSVPMLQYK